jgi:beta-lactamase class A
MHLIGRFVAVLLAFLAFAGQPALAAGAASGSLTDLEQQLNSLLADKSADVGIAALDLNTGEIVSIKGDTPFPMASTVKVAVAALYLAQVDHGRRSLDDRINGVSARSLMARMLIHSDNRATDMLLKNLGGPDALHDWLQDNGVQGLRVDRTIAQLLSAKRDLWDRRDSSTPVAMVDLLKRIYKAELIKPQSRNYLLDLMAQCQTGRNRIKALLPTGTPVEHKTGTLNGLTDDVGFITLPDGRRVAVAIFARGGSNRPRTIAEAARAIYDGFTTVFTWPFRPALSAQ